MSLLWVSSARLPAVRIAQVPNHAVARFCGAPYIRCRCHATLRISHHVTAASSSSIFKSPYNDVIFFVRWSSSRRVQHEEFTNKCTEPMFGLRRFPCRLQQRRGASTTLRRNAKSKSNDALLNPLARSTAHQILPPKAPTVHALPNVDRAQTPAP